MPISFSCRQCGKDYVVSDGLAGKRGTCKSCGNKMVIPGAPAASPAPAARPAPAPQRGPVAVARPVARRPEPEPPTRDIYGLDEEPAPLPTMMPRTAYNQAATAEAPAKKKKKKGFFSSGKKKSSSGGSFQSIGTGIGGLRLIGIIVGVVAGIAGSWGLMSKSSMEGSLEKLIALANEGTSLLRPINDAASASVAAPRVRAVFQRINETVDPLKGKKGRKNEVEDVERRYGPRVEAAFAALGNELRRVLSIPGAHAALGIDDQIQHLAGGMMPIPQAPAPPVMQPVAPPAMNPGMPPGLSGGPQPGAPPGPRPGGFPGGGPPGRGGNPRTRF